MRPSFRTSAGEPTHKCKSEAPSWNIAKNNRSMGEPEEEEGAWLVPGSTVDARLM